MLRPTIQEIEETMKVVAKEGKVYQVEAAVDYGLTQEKGAPKGFKFNISIMYRIRYITYN